MQAIIIIALLCSGVNATPATARPRLYNTTNETANFDYDEYGVYGFNPGFPGDYKDLYYNMTYFDYTTYRVEYLNIGVYPPDIVTQAQGGGKFKATNGSSGSVSTQYPNSTVDHFQLYSLAIGCEATTTQPVPGSSTQTIDLPYPVNCTVHAAGYNCKINPFGFPIAKADLEYRPRLGTGFPYPSGVSNTTAVMQQVNLPKSFHFLDKVVFTATLDNAPPGVPLNYMNGLSVKITQLRFSVSRLQPSF